MIVSGGANVYPAEVEAALSEHPAVADMAVIGLPDEEWGRRVHAVIESADRRAPASVDELQRHCRERLTAYKVPKSYEFVDRLPRTEAGKINRSALTEARETAAPTGSPEQPHVVVTTEVRNVDDSLTTAHRAWDERWANPPLEQRWQIPEPLVVGLLARLRSRGATRAVDVGCGLGRHARFLAAQGLWVHGLDAAPRGLRFASDGARDADLAAATWSQAMFTQLPLRGASFDAAIAWNVVYHGDAEVVRTAIAELARVLRPDAIVVATMLSTRSSPSRRRSRGETEHLCGRECRRRSCPPALLLRRARLARVVGA